MYDDVEWSMWLDKLPQEDAAAFEHTLRRTLAKRLRNLAAAHGFAVPETVRSSAVGVWRKTYMAGKSKTARKRMNYARLQNEPTYQEIEREQLFDYWRSKLPGRRLPDAADVESMPFDQVCDTYAVFGVLRGNSGLEHIARAIVTDAYATSSNAERLYSHMTKPLLEIARTKNLYKLAHVTMPDQAPFHLGDLTTIEEVAERVHAARVVPRLLRTLYGNGSAHSMTLGLIFQELSALPHIQALDMLLRGLVCDGNMLESLVRSVAKGDIRVVARRLESHELEGQVARALLKNPRYGKEFQRAVELRLRVRESVPETPMEAFPLARTMHRHFVIHVGPTNSGKTHAALEALKDAQSGTYLGPLRLLAYEQFERLNRDGCPCSLLTGEELMEVPGARHVASTVEMADYAAEVDVAVIDEAQMIADGTRGHSWTNALLGIPAWEVHVCCAPHALRIVRRLVGLCEDTYEIERHERLVPLVAERGSFRLPDDVRPGDALVVFSRRSVHAVAAEVGARGLRASLIYGALPYAVRHDEARKFEEGATDVVVATDAIGMGMNLPIRRVVFVEQEKFDGTRRRPLRAEEIQQIAGRAGRYGRYDQGSFRSTRLDREFARKCREKVADIAQIPVGIPLNIALVRDATLSDAIRQWATFDQPDPFNRMDVARDLRLIDEIEKNLDDGQATDPAVKRTVLSLATMPFDETDRRLLQAWRAMVDAQLTGGVLELPVPAPQPAQAALTELEGDYRYCDLLYCYERVFGTGARAQQLTDIRNRISQAIIDRLAAQAKAPPQRLEAAQEPAASRQEA